MHDDMVGCATQPLAPSPVAAHIGSAVDGICTISKHAYEVRKAAEDTATMVAKTIGKIVGSNPNKQQTVCNRGQSATGESKDPCLLTIFENHAISLNSNLAIIMANLTAIREEITRL